MNLSFDEAPKMAWVLRVISVAFRGGSAKYGMFIPKYLSYGK
jgi:hypothetical protein